MSDTDWLYDQIEDLKAENAALREDAERYRWLCYFHDDGDSVHFDYNEDTPDVAIDKARKE